MMDKDDEGYLGWSTTFPLPFFLMVAGYTLILIIDKVLFDTHIILDDHGDGHGHGGGS